VFGGEPDQDCRTIPLALVLRGTDALAFFSAMRRGEWRSFDIETNPYRIEEHERMIARC
jgi:hypothetical protein